MPLPLRPLLPPALPAAAARRLDDAAAWRAAAGDASSVETAELLAGAGAAGVAPAPRGLGRPLLCSVVAASRAWSGRERRRSGY